jgi:hypothetical protein
MSSAKKNPLNNYAKYSVMVFQMAAIIFGGCYLGMKLDEHFKLKTPVFTASLALASVFLAMYFSIRDFIRKK